MSVALDDQRRNRADARDHQEHVPAPRNIRGRRAVAQDAFEYTASGALSGALSDTKCQCLRGDPEMAGAVFWRGWRAS